MLRRTLLASAGAMALTGTAFAADLGARPPPPVFLPPPPVFTWTGLYTGLNAGYEWAASRNVDTTTVPVFAAPTFGTELALSSALATGSVALNPNGFIGGGQVGYNYQFYNSWVVGIEADIQGLAGTHASGSFSGSGHPAAVPGETIESTVQSDKRIDYLGTVRGRLGFTITPTLLIYGTGGLAYGGVDAATGIGQENLPFAPGFGSFGSLSNSRVGWTAGGGLEWLFAPNWSAKVEYLYYDIGRVTYGLSPLAFNSAVFGLAYSSSPFSTTRFNGNIVRAGINYHFNFLPPPIVAKY
ncbi:MAG: outer membrane protein [Methylocella sp.]